ncbi:MAG: protein kinase [Acidobacteriota bacterium]
MSHDSREERRRRELERLAEAIDGAAGERLHEGGRSPAKPEDDDSFTPTRVAATQVVPTLQNDATTTNPGRTVAVSASRATRTDETPEAIGRYRIEAELGRGGMGVVYRARDPQLDRLVALKAISARLPAEALERFVREARMLAAASHPNVGGIFDIVEHEGEPVLVLEYLDGESLWARLRRGSLDVELAIDFATQVAAGLDAAHSRGLIHRDLKPPNIQIVDGDVAKVLDFGLARPVEEDDDADGERKLEGTPGYMSPEQSRGEELDARTDVWALGVVLFEMLTGQSAFPGASWSERLSAVLHGEPDWSALPDELSTAASDLLRRCLAKDRQERPASGAELRVLLTRAAPLTTASSTPSSSELPPERDTFIGRATELAALVERTSTPGLLTVLGPGGTGKTRLVLHHARRFQNISRFCDLSEARSIEGIASVVATALGVSLKGDDPIEQLGHAIAGRGRCLIILDNFEQVAAHAAATLGRWLEQAGDATFIVTSRVLLDLPGEEVLDVPPLDVKGAGVELFESRAHAKKASFVVTDENRAQVEEVVRLVDGLPLAIELAAARVRVLTPAQLVERMKDRFRLLAGGTGVRERQATMRAAIDWSWQLLTSWERAALAQASVFEAGFTLEAAEAVLDLGAWADAPWPLDAVQVLVDKSLLRTWTPEGTDEPRFGAYASIQEYAAEKLRTDDALDAGASGSDAEHAAFVRHGEHFAGLGLQEALESLDRHGGVTRRRALGLELDNLVSACRRAVTRGDGTTAVPTLQAAWAVLEARGPFGLGSELARSVLALPDPSPLDRARVSFILGRASKLLGQVEETGACYEAAIALAREAGDRASAGNFLNGLGILHHDQGRMDEARACYDEALPLSRELGDRNLESNVLGNLGVFHGSQGRMDEALTCSESALAIVRELGNRMREGSWLGNVGHLHLIAGRTAQARECLEQGLALSRETGERKTEGLMLLNLGAVDEREDRKVEARALYEAALTIVREVGEVQYEAWTRWCLGNLDLDLGRLEEARTSFEETIALVQRMGDRGTLGLALCGRGHCQQRAGEHEAAVATLAEAEAVSVELGVGPDSELGKALAKLREELRVG